MGNDGEKIEAGGLGAEVVEVERATFTMGGSVVVCSDAGDDKGAVEVEVGGDACLAREPTSSTMSLPS